MYQVVDRAQHSHSVLKSNSRPNSRTAVAALLYTCAGAVLYGSAALFVFLPTWPSLSVLQWEPSQHAVCFSLYRKSDHAIVHVAVGTPARTYRLLLRLDRVVTAPSNSGVVLTSANALFSQTNECAVNQSAATATCSDVSYIVQPEGGGRVDGVVAPPKRKRSTASLRYIYGTAALNSGSTATTLGLDGELLLCAGCTAYITAQEVCIESTNKEDGPSAALAEQQGLHVDLYETGVAGVRLAATSATALRAAGPPWADAAAASPHCANSTPVLYMPASAGLEAGSALFPYSAVRDAWDAATRLGIADAIAAGATCASEQSELVAYKGVVATQCSGVYAQFVCTGAQPSLPFRTAAAYRLRICCDDSACAIHAAEDRALLSMINLADQDAMLAATWQRLLLGTLAAFIVWLRSSDAEASVDSLLYRLLKHTCAHARNEVFEKRVVSFDQFTSVLGLSACAARLVCVGARFESMAADGNLRLVALETIAAIASAVHFLVYAIDMGIDFAHTLALRLRDGSPLKPVLQAASAYTLRGDALAALGGSAMVIDVSCATMLAFTDTPTLAGPDTFASVARMLAATALSLIGVCRCKFSITAAGLLLQADQSPVALAVAISSCAYWSIQTIAITCSVVDAFIQPLVDHMARHDTGAQTPMAALIAAAILCLAVPRIHANLRSISALRGLCG